MVDFSQFIFRVAESYLMMFSLCSLHCNCVGKHMLVYFTCLIVSWPRTPGWEKRGGPYDALDQWEMRWWWTGDAGDQWCVGMQSRDGIDQSQTGDAARDAGVGRARGCQPITEEQLTSHTRRELWLWLWHTCEESVSAEMSTKPIKHERGVLWHFYILEDIIWYCFEIVKRFFCWESKYILELPRI